MIDLLPTKGGALIPVAGGAPFNVARILARLTGHCAFLTTLSEDRFGEILRRELLAAGVSVLVHQRVAAPTTLAMAQLDADGSADYRFYGEGTAAALLSGEHVPGDFFGGLRALALGGLGLVLEPLRSTLVELVRSAPAGLTVVLDPNCRPRAVADPVAYRRTVELLLARTTILKVSRHDLLFLAPESDPLRYCRELLSHGPSIIVMTDGPHEILVVTPQGARSVPVPEVTVDDTIGAGDALVAGLLAWLDEHPELALADAGLDLLEHAVARAAEVAGAVCTMRGANLPERFSWGDARVSLR